MKITEDDVGKRYRRKDGAIVIITGWKSHGENSGFVVETNFCMYNTLGDSDEYNADYALVECLDDAEHLLCPCGCQLDRDVAEEFDHGMGYFDQHLKNKGLNIKPTVDEQEKCPCGCGLPYLATLEMDNNFQKLQEHLKSCGMQADAIRPQVKPEVEKAQREADEILAKLYPDRPLTREEVLRKLSMHLVICYAGPQSYENDFNGCAEKTLKFMEDALGYKIPVPDKPRKSITLEEIGKALPIDEEADARVMELMGRKAGEEIARKLLKK